MSYPLERPLVFGDTEQIAALQLIRAKAEEADEIERQKAEGDLKEYEVIVSFTGEATVNVWARCKPEAALLGQEKAHIAASDIEIENVHAKEV